MKLSVLPTIPIRFGVIVSLVAFAALPTSAQTLLTSGDASGGLTLNPSLTALALNFGAAAGSGDIDTVQGVTFTNVSSGSTTVNGVTFATTGFDASLAPAGGTPSPNLGIDANSVALADVANTLVYDSTSNEGTFTISGLKASTAYNIDFLTDLIGYSPRNLTFTVGTATSSFTSPNTGVYDTQLTFTTDALGAISGSITSDANPFMDGLVVTEAAAVPEPSSWALMGTGLLVLTFLRRRSLNI